MKLIFDTETTGLVNWKSIDHLVQPRMVQLAGILVDTDWNEQSVFSMMIEPEGFEIPTQASDIHGITTERATKYGIPIKTALSVFNNTVRNAEEIWAFNLAFDTIIVNSEFERIGQPSRLILAESKCSMLQCKDILKLKPNFKGADYKFPKLSEAYEFFFPGEVIEKAHDALADVRATVRVMKAAEKWNAQA